MTIRDHWESDGYVVLRKAFDDEYVQSLRESAEIAYQQFMLDSRPEVEPQGRSFGPDSWIMSHLNHPRYYRERRQDLVRLMDAIAHPLCVDAARRILGDEPAFVQVNLYVDPSIGRPGTWHRDCQFRVDNEADEYESFVAEADPPREIHMHIPLVYSQATAVVPGSHKDWDTPEQLLVRRSLTEGAMPGGVRINMQPGDLAFFHVNSLHRGFYDDQTPRRTIAVTFVRQDMCRPITTESMLGEIFPYTFQPWVGEPGYLDGVSPSARSLFESFIRTHGRNWSESNLKLLTPERRSYFE